MTFDRMWSAIAPIGRDGASGGYRRFAWSREDSDLREWFAGESERRGLDLTTDRAGNQSAWWGDPDATTAILFVRNPTGISHSPAEHAERDDCLAEVRALARVTQELAG